MPRTDDFLNDHWTDSENTRVDRCLRTLSSVTQSLTLRGLPDRLDLNRWTLLPIDGMCQPGLDKRSFTGQGVGRQS